MLDKCQTGQESNMVALSSGQREYDTKTSQIAILLFVSLRWPCWRHKNIGIYSVFALKNDRHLDNRHLVHSCY